MEIDQILKLIIYYLELFPDELFEQKYISILIDIIKSIDVGSQSTPDLPSIRAFKTVKAISIRMYIL